tara:strand:- start:600 stop:851 length:252 start_codon:yes stop_codon:yes gene_type:complete
MNKDMGTCYSALINKNMEEIYRKVPDYNIDSTSESKENTQNEPSESSESSEDDRIYEQVESDFVVINYNDKTMNDAEKKDHHI